MEIVFLNEADAVQLQTFLQKHGFDDTFTKKNDVYIFSFPVKSQRLNRYIDTLANFIIHVKRGEFLHKMLSDRFFYENKEEREHIIEIVTDMCNGNREELIALTEKMYEFDLVQDAISSCFLTSDKVLFDSLLTFRLKEYRQSLIRFLHIAIDEYKMEQEYQMFVNMLREYLRKRNSIIKTVRLSIEEDITFFDEYFQVMEKEVVAEMVDRRLLANHPVYIDSAVIAPLLSMAPERVFLYTPYEEKPLVRTLKVIFEERMTILPPIK